MRIVLVALVVAGLAVPALAQSQLAIGQAGTGRLDAGERARWTFTADAGDVVQVDVESAAFDPVVEVFGADGASLGRDDDGGDGLSSRLANLRLPAAGRYEIVVSAYHATAAGAYRVALSRQAALPTRPTAYGRTVRDRLPAGARHGWTFRAAAGDVVTLELSGAFDTVLDLLAPDGRTLATDDDSGGDRQARLTGVRLAQTGEHTVVARGYNTVSDEGSYTLRLTRTGGRGTSVPDCGQVEPQYGGVRLGTRVRIGRHRPVEGDANWDDGMDAYVGLEAVVARLGGVDGVGCTMVGLDVDGGAFAWRLRDLARLPSRPTTPQACRAGGAPDYGGVRVGAEVTLGRHRTIGGSDNWSARMDAFVGQRTRVRTLGGVDRQGCALVTVDADDGDAFWRVRDLTLW